MRRLGNGQKKTKKRPKHLGEMRTTQLITSYGVGAIVDFRDETGILAEADHWYYKNDPDEDRVIHCHSLEKILDKDFFVMPKWDSVPHTVYQKYRSRDIGAYRFPNMLYCPRCCRLIHEKTLGGIPVPLSQGLCAALYGLSYIQAGSFGHYSMDSGGLYPGQGL